ncbi:MAG: sulfotransferase family 2 domain-containing protein [Opitutales bacterium]
MSNFYIRRPECVFIHVPKTGGSTIRRGLFGDLCVGPVFGEIPSEWEGLYKFGFVRHPFDRLVSAFEDFAQKGGFKSSFLDFVDIAFDDTISFNKNRRTLEENIRHHCIPMSHPFNCLQFADYIGRYENYSKDLQWVMEKLGFSLPHLPHLRKTIRKHWQYYFNKDVLLKCYGFYKEDFHKFNYKKPF